MSTQLIHELGEFHQFVGEKVRSGDRTMSPEEALDEWRTLQPSADEIEDDLDAIQEALDAIDDGDKGVSVEEFDREFRSRHNLPARS